MLERSSSMLVMSPSSRLGSPTRLPGSDRRGRQWMRPGLWMTSDSPVHLGLSARCGRANADPTAPSDNRRLVLASAPQKSCRALLPDDPRLDLERILQSAPQSEGRIANRASDWLPTTIHASDCDPRCELAAPWRIRSANRHGV